MSQLGRGEEALECYDAAVQIEPLSAMLRHNRGYRRLRLGHEEGARTDLRVAANLGESKWGRQARRLLLEQWGEKIQLQALQTSIEQAASSTPVADRFSRGSRTVESWLQHGSASPSDMLHHNLDSVGGPLTMTVTPRTHERIQSATTGGPGQVVPADTAQALPAGFSISSPMHWPTVQPTDDAAVHSFWPTTGRLGSPSVADFPLVVDNASSDPPRLNSGAAVCPSAVPVQFLERNRNGDCTGSDPPRTWRSRQWSSAASSDTRGASHGARSRRCGALSDRVRSTAWWSRADP
jgi:hypothetical protein